MVAHRGELWWIKQPTRSEQAVDVSKARRPYVVVSNDAWNTVSTYPRVTVCPLTGAEHVPRRYDTDIWLSHRDTGLAKDSVVRCVELYTLFRDQLIERIGLLAPRKLEEIDRALALYLGIESLFHGS